jgi:hypothetical protein
MRAGNGITDLPPEICTHLVDQLLTISDDTKQADPLNFACLRLSSREVRTLCDAAVRRLDLHNRSGQEMRHLLQRFTGAAACAP